MTFQLRILTREIAAALSACTQVVEANSKVPILRTTRISIADGIASFMATNTDQTVIARAACEGHGIACIDTAALDTKIRALKPGDIVNFEGDGKFVTITQGRTKWKVPVLLDDFPVQVGDAMDGDAVPFGRDFLVALKNVHTAIDPNVPTPAIQGVFLDGIQTVGTNGKQLRVVAHGTAVASNVILPLSVASKIPAMFPDGGKITVSSSSAQFSSEFLTLKTRLIDATYPDYRRIIVSVSDMDGLVHVDGSDFIAAVNRASAIKASGEKSGSYFNVQLRIRADEIEIFTRNSEGEEGTDYVRCDRVSGNDTDIGFNGAFLVSAAQSLDADTVAIRYGSLDKPIIMSPVGSEREDIRIVMPRMFS